MYSPKERLKPNTITKTVQSGRERERFIENQLRIKN
jgi:hypothetical protein